MLRTDNRDPLMKELARHLKGNAAPKTFMHSQFPFLNAGVPDKQALVARMPCQAMTLGPSD
jgi:hypothetical protein